MTVTDFSTFRMPPAINKVLSEHDGALVHHTNEIDYLRSTLDRVINQFAAYAMRTDQELERLRALCEGQVHG